MGGGEAGRLEWGVNVCVCGGGGAVGVGGVM